MNAEASPGVRGKAIYLTPTIPSETYRDYPNMDVVRSIARRWAPNATTRQDLEGEGLMGLMEAESKYDPERGVPLRAFVRVYIRGRMIDYVRKICGRIQWKCAVMRGRDGEMQYRVCPKCGLDFRAEPTPKQTEVLKLLVEGKTNIQIGKALGITSKCVSMRLAHLARRFNADPNGNQRVQIVTRYYEMQNKVTQ